MWTSAFDTAVSSELQVQKADSQVTPSPSLMCLCILYLILPLCPLATIVRTKDRLIQKADASRLLSRDEPVRRYFPTIACNLSSSQNKYVPCRLVFDGWWLFIVSRLGHVRMMAWLQYRIFSLETRQGCSRKAQWWGSWRLVRCNSNHHSFHTVWGKVLRKPEVS